MNIKNDLHKLIDNLPESRLCELLDFAEFLAWQDERRSWQQYGQGQFARAFSETEPEYNMADVKSGRYA